MTQQKIANHIETASTKDRVVSILDGVSDAVALMDWNSYQDMAETIEGVDLDFKVIMMLLRQLKVWAKLTEGVDIPF